MDRALPEMLHCRNMPAGNVAGVKFMQQQQQQDQSCFNEFSMLSFLPPHQAQDIMGLNMDCSPNPDEVGPGLNELLTRPVKAGPKLSGTAGRQSFKKRKAEKNLTTMVDIEEDGRSKKSKGCTEEEESKTEQNSNSNQRNHKESNVNNNDNKFRDISGCSSKDNSKDYIHVRARRGQATDSHSLAERVRREKISERMKYLQDLVPGCNKITGKAGMLDEIINYVQSLQRQVEFLSMKLAAVNPSLDFTIDDLIAKEVFAACSTSISTMGISPDLTNNPSYPQYNPVQQMDPIEMGLRRTISAPVSRVLMPETFIDTSCFNLIPSSLAWDVDLQNVYTMEFQQGRSTPFPLETFTGR